MREVLFAGFGGQGVLTAGLILSQIALYAGNNATWMPSYGAAMRGGTANCTVHYGGGPVYNPGQQKPDLLLAMNTPSFKKFVGIPPRRHRPLQCGYDDGGGPCAGGYTPGGCPL